MICIIEKIPVSVIVITFNSANYVLDTLESIKMQTHRNLELIVSDDASTDKTVQLTSEWIEKNNSRFMRAEVVCSDRNTGITPNINRGIKAASGEFIKLIAGDDILFDTCIEEMLGFCIKKDLDFAYSKVLPFVEGKTNIPFKAKLIYESQVNNQIFDLPCKEQYRRLLTSFEMFTIGLFLRASFIEKMGLFDETYMMMEDYPFALKVTSLGYKLELLNRFLIKYRVRSIEVAKKIRSTRRKSVHTSDLERFEKEELIPRLKKERMYIALYNTYIRRLERRIVNASDNLVIEYFGKLIGYLSLSKITGRIGIIWTRLKLGKLHRGITK